MKVITHLNESLFPPHKSKICLAIGNFDGVHKGHLKLIRELGRAARRDRGIPAVFTFVRHPRLVLNPKKPLPILTPWQERLALLKKAGIKVAYLIHFTKKLSLLSPKEFVRQVLVRKIGVNSVFMGLNARFGHNRKGAAHTMRTLARKYSFSFRPVKTEKLENRVLNSSRIRNLVARGKIYEAAKILGRPVTLFGRVIRGSGRGKKLGFPTANLKPESDAFPPCGVYAVFTDVISYRYKRRAYGFQFSENVKFRKIPGALNLGFRPTFEKKITAASVRTKVQPIPEIFLFNFSGSLYGKHLKVSLVKYLRKEKKYHSPRLLIEQIKKDVQIARKLLRKR